MVLWDRLKELYRDLALTRRQAVALWIFLSIFLLATGVRLGLRRGWFSGPIEVLPGDATVYRVDLNRAEAVELELLPGIGPKRAADILAYRQRAGGFRSVEELREAAGLSRGEIEVIRPLAIAGAVVPEVIRQ